MWFMAPQVFKKLPFCNGVTGSIVGACLPKVVWCTTSQTAKEVNRPVGDNDTALNSARWISLSMLCDKGYVFMGLSVLVLLDGCFCEGILWSCVHG